MFEAASGACILGWTSRGSHRDYQWPVTFSGHGLALSLLFGSLLQKHFVCWDPPSSLAVFLHGILHSASPALSLVLATSSPWKILKHFFLPHQSSDLSYSSSKSCTDLLSSEFPRLERDTSPPEHCPYARTPRGFTCCLIPLKLSSRPGLGEAGPQEKLTEKHSWAENLFIPPILSKCPWTKDISSLPFSFDCGSPE